VVAVAVRDVEVVGLAELLPVETAVVGERKPRTKESGVNPRVAEHRTAESLDKESGMSESRNAHVKSLDE
jgi:hypothetical protein